VYEKALIERYVEENGTDPISGEALTKEDLIDVKASTFQYSKCEKAVSDLDRTIHASTQTGKPDLYPCFVDFAPVRV
jgi:hypothetical protein